MEASDSSVGGYEPKLDTEMLYGATDTPMKPGSRRPAQPSPRLPPNVPPVPTAGPRLDPDVPEMPYKRKNLPTDVKHDMTRKLGSLQQHYYSQGQAQAIAEAGLTKEAKAGKLDKLLALTAASGAGAGIGMHVNDAIKARMAMLNAAGKAENAKSLAGIQRMLESRAARAVNVAEPGLPASLRGPEGIRALFGSAEQKLPEVMGGPEAMKTLFGGVPAAPRSFAGLLNPDHIVDMATKL